LSDEILTHSLAGKFLDDKDSPWVELNIRKAMVVCQVNPVRKGRALTPPKYGVDAFYSYHSSITLGLSNGVNSLVTPLYPPLN
jgi:hypothetical protein